MCVAKHFLLSLPKVKGVRNITTVPVCLRGLDAWRGHIHITTYVYSFEVVMLPRRIDITTSYEIFLWSRDAPKAYRHYDVSWCSQGVSTLRLVVMLPRRIDITTCRDAPKAYRHNDLSWCSQGGPTLRLLRKVSFEVVMLPRRIDITTCRDAPKADRHYDF